MLATPSSSTRFVRIRLRAGLPLGSLTGSSLPSSRRPIVRIPTGPGTGWPLRIAPGLIDP